MNIGIEFDRISALKAEREFREKTRLPTRGRRGAGIMIMAGGYGFFEYILPHGSYGIFNLGESEYITRFGNGDVRFFFEVSQPNSKWHVRAVGFNKLLELMEGEEE